MTLTSEIKREYIVRLAQSGNRIDNRRFEEYRTIEIYPNLIKRAEGSAKVKIGNTQVLTGIKLDIGEPYPDSPFEGVMTTSAEMIPMASPDFEGGPPGKEAIELARVVDRGIREAEVIELDKLCIVPRSLVWIIFIDIHILDYDGNLFDAASLASLAALYTTRVPVNRLREALLNYAEEYPLINDYLERHKEDFPLPLREPPISCTSVKFNGVVAIDPSLDEEEIADARLTVATDVKGDIRAVQKGLSGSFTVDEIKKIIKLSIDNGKKIRELLYKSLGK